MLIGGQVVLRDKRFPHLDEGELREAAERTNHDVLRRIGITPKPAWPVL